MRKSRFVRVVWKFPKDSIGLIKENSSIGESFLDMLAQIIAEDIFSKRLDTLKDTRVDNGVNSHRMGLKEVKWVV